MRTEEYKGLMGEIGMTPRLKEKILRSAAVGCEPRPLGERRSHPRLMKILSVAATLATLAVVITAFVLIVRFIGPEGGHSSIGSELGESGFKLISISTDCDQLSAEVIGYNPDQQSVIVKWSFDDGYEGWSIEHEPMILSQKKDDRWIIRSKPSNGEITIKPAIAEYKRINETTSFGFAGYELSAGHFLIEKSFVLNKLTKGPTSEANGGGLEIGERVGEYVLKIEFELTSVSEHDEEFALISISTNCESVNVNFVDYSEAGRIITVRWHCPEDTPVRILYKSFELEKYVDGAWTEMERYPDESDGISTQYQYKNGYNEYLDLDRYYKGIEAGRYRLTRVFTNNSDPCLLTVEFELIDPSERRELYDYVLDRFIPLSFTADLPEGVEASFVGYDGKSVYCRLRNNSGATVYYDEPCALHEDVNGAWVINHPLTEDVKPPVALPNGETVTVGFGVNCYISELKNGQYMVCTAFYSSERPEDHSGSVEIVFEWDEEGAITECDGFKLNEVSTGGGVDDVKVMGYNDGTLELVWQNNSEYELSFGPYFSIKHLVDGEWVYDFGVDVDFNDVYFSFAGSMYAKDTLPIKFFFADLKPDSGVYRVSKNYTLGGENYTLTLEFSLGEPADENFSSTSGPTE